MLDVGVSLRDLPSFPTDCQASHLALPRASLPVVDQTTSWAPWKICDAMKHVCFDRNGETWPRLNNPAQLHRNSSDLITAFYKNEEESVWKVLRSIATRLTAGAKKHNHIQFHATFKLLKSYIKTLKRKKCYKVTQTPSSAKSLFSVIKAEKAHML